MKNALPVWLLTLGGLLIAFALPQMNPLQGLPVGPGLGAKLAREAFWWAVGALLLVYVVRVERLPLSSIGLRWPTRATYLCGGLGAVVLLACIGLCYGVVFPRLGLKMNQQALANLTANPLWLRLLLVARAGLVEEILYRGYPIERLGQLTGSKWLAAALSVVVFTLVHLAYWGGAQLLIASVAGSVLALLYLWRRDLAANMLAHFLVDLAGFLAAPAHR